MRPMRKAAPEPAPVAVAEGGCRHKWVLEIPNGPTSRGTCRLCGEVREFRNYLTSSYWEDMTVAEERPIGGHLPIEVDPSETE
ncbi:MAG: hypothetical protein NZ951_01555 [Dehalococcoidia bacterium]|nr:hypothetical protein [Dehalococcoidia bacterium]MDW8119516.1 hypothetical protein [Chloroflexota bacterium]